jgi:hypothetical protein
MAYFIFLKSFRSLEEFRKNPHVKIPPKSSCANFQSIAIIKILIFIQKGIFFGSRPIWPSPAPYWPAPPCRPPAPRSAHLAQAALRQRRLLSFTSSPCGARLSAPSPSSRRPTVAVSPRRLWPHRTAQLHPRMPPEPLLTPPSFPPP